MNKGQVPSAGLIPGNDYPFNPPIRAERTSKSGYYMHFSHGTFVEYSMWGRTRVAVFIGKANGDKSLKEYKFLVPVS